jgi:thiamine biosynthesis lipoprotein ApbE
MISVNFCFLAGCSQKKEMVYTFPSLFVIQKDGDGKTKVESDDIITPFNTVIQTSLYCYDGDYSKEQLSQMEEEYEEKICYYHALSDRHYYYTYEGKKINNIKVINDSYGTEKPVSLTPYLYDLLKKSYEFTINSEGRFNIFLGKLNDVYEKKIDEVHSLSSISSYDQELMDVTGLYFSSFDEDQKEEIASYTQALPTVEEMKQILTFDDGTYSVTFHSLKDDNGEVRPIEISLGGSAKGYMTEYYANEIQKEYPGICLIMNSGTSSIKATNMRVDGKAFKVRYINPSYQEQVNAIDSSYNDYEVTLTLDGPFSISTSGNYEKYFFEYDNGNFVRRSHILNSETGYSQNSFDQVSVIMDDAFMADMYTTALMNTSSIDYAKKLLSTLNDSYGLEAKAIITKKMDQEHDYEMNLNHYSPLDENHFIIKENGQYKTKLSDSFKEVYYVDESLSSSFSLMEKSKLKNPQNVVSEIKIL